jgi:hypothetical protein
MMTSLYQHLIISIIYLKVALGYLVVIKQLPTQDMLSEDISSSMLGLEQSSLLIRKLGWRILINYLNMIRKMYAYLQKMPM